MTDTTSLLSRQILTSETSFNNLMKKRIYQVLLISSKYDAFILEEDGRIDEQIFNEYVSLNLRYPPQFIQAATEEEAFTILEEINIDLIVTMLSVDKTSSFELAFRLKKKYPSKPIVVLTPFSREISIKLVNEDLSAIDYVFCWLGNADILLAIIKLIEDKMNLEHDVKEVGVQVILLVEDSIRFYSSYLPNIYKIIFKQSLDFMTEGLNEHQQMLRMRGRPKILLATNFEDALSLYNKYKNNMLGVISDISYRRNGEMDKTAGLRLTEIIKQDDPLMPILLQSSDLDKEQAAKEMKAGFLYKRSKTLSLELKNFITEYFAFGDFVFIDPADGKEITRASDLKSLQQRVFEIPDECLEYHITRNHFSKWLRARALFPIAELFKNIRPEDFKELDDIRRFIFDAIATFRINKSRGIIAEFYRDRFDEYLTFTRIGKGSIGGKARGLAFLDTLIKRNRLFEFSKDVIITIPRTVVICADVFDEFMEENELYKIALSEIPDEEILQHFIHARLPFRIHEDMYTFLSVINNPIAIRSSSMLEDSHYQPFAGVYSTYMIPNVRNDERLMIENLSNSIKSVYASAFFKDSKAYMSATSNVIDEEKMAIVLQEVCGRSYGNRFYPALSGVTRSINFYPIPPEKPEDGIVNIAFGLGKYIVDGGSNLRFSPKFPKKVLQLTTPEMALRETQKVFYALDMDPNHFTPSTDDSVNILKVKISDAEGDSALRYAASTYDFDNNLLRDGLHPGGKKLITFSNVLNHHVFPLSDILAKVLKIGQHEMNKPIEIEFAVDLDTPKGEPKVFYLLQIRPIVEADERMQVNITDEDLGNAIITTNAALGNGVINNLYDLVYVKPETFKPADTRIIASRVDELNDALLREKRNYVLIGPGRWGSSDPWLGIPVKWPQISGARLIIESGLENYRVDPSQGTHFFQNLTSFRVGYFTINPFMNDGKYDLEYLRAKDAVYEDEYIRHIRFDHPIVVKIDGKKNRGVVLK